MTSERAGAALGARHVATDESELERSAWEVVIDARGVVPAIDAFRSGAG